MRGSLPAGTSHGTDRTAWQLIDYVEQSSRDLTYQLFESAAPREAVSVLSERTLRLPGGCITLAIIGSSHFLEIEAADKILCELLACPRPRLDAARKVAETGGGGKWSHQLCGEAFSYQFKLWRHRYPLRRFEQKISDLTLPHPDRMQYTFPGADGAGSAITSLQWWVDGPRATVATHHTFPGESTIVHTQSVIDFSRAGASR